MASKKNIQFIEKIVRDKNTRQIFDDVFDNATIMAVHDLSRKKYFRTVEHIIATGKEGNVFKCKAGKNFFALKIYKIETSEFKHMTDYLKGDERFKNVRKDKLEIIKAWTKKEFRNLNDLNKVGVRVPLPIASNRNCLVMEYIGDEEGNPSPTAKKKPFENPEKQYKLMCEYMAVMVKAKLVHADLSEYNILNKDEEMIIIDVGQTVSTLHPKAQEFFERDVRNLSKWFRKQGIDTDYEKMYADIKSKK